MKYKCIVLDHDDTVVNSTATIHYPSFLYTLACLRPNVSLTLEDYFKINADPGFLPYCKDILGFSDAEMAIELADWQRFVSTCVPKAYPQISDLLEEFINRGGHVCVVSHSFRENILRDYRENQLPMPELVYGWELPSEKRKPAAFPLEDIMEKLDLKPYQLLMVDDLIHGKIMADHCGVDFAAAGWAYYIPEISEKMRRECRFFCDTVQDLSDILFADQLAKSLY